MPRPSIRIALLQLNPIVGDLSGNTDAILRQLRQAGSAGAQIAVTPELALTGYPPEDLLLRPAFIRSAAASLDRLARQVRGTALICGHPEALSGHRGVMETAGLYNSASVLSRGRRLIAYRKIALPNYGVFDERRYFAPGDRALLLEARTGAGDTSRKIPITARVAVSICEDLWPEAQGRYLDALRGARPDVLINLSASPYTRAKMSSRLTAMRAAARQTGAHVVYVNLVGGQDELIFDGRSFVVSPEGRVLVQAKAFAEDLLCVDLPIRAAGTGRSGRKTLRVPLPLTVGVPASPMKPDRAAAPLSSEEEVLTAVEFSLREYVRKNGFKSVGVAMSGGIDSAVVAAIAVRALGADRVIGVTLPSRITSRATLSDAILQARNLGIRFFQISIRGVVDSFLKALGPAVRGSSGGAMEENLQARARGTLMMALSNRMGFLLLATGNKSELATGYCTLYGDMAGGFAPLKDLNKEWVYRLARRINLLEGKPMVPLRVIRRAPTAELRPGQKDQDTLPPYELLDRLLEDLVERDRPADQLTGKGPKFRAAASETARRLVLNEYKRRQAPIGPKITSKAFGRDRRMPITQRGGERF